MYMKHFPFSEMDLKKLSESVYVGLCLKLGTPQEVAIRREVNDTEEIVDTEVNSRNPHNNITMLSGSRGEGFRFNDSDLDIMHWGNSERVVWNFSQVQFYNTSSHNVLLSDSSVSAPGFTLLWFPLHDASIFVQFCSRHIVNINGLPCVSSRKYRNAECTFKNFKTHGPCTSGRIGDTEIEHAHCLFSEFWPPIASSWVNRCHAWPSPNVVDGIIKSGCHLVAIGHKLGKHVNDEWRISFSMAEKKLVYCMNHTQFLTYGLLKLFLKEIINNGLNEEEKILCSYHIKTVVYWAIQQNTMFDWCPKNLLEGFWVCFKLLLKWIYEGICPNFFIPENNMFLNNVYGYAQEMLYTRMQSLYEMGILFLLQSPSIRPHITRVLCNPSLSTVTHESNLLSELELDLHLFNEIFLTAKSDGSDDLCQYLECIKVVEQMLCSPYSEIQILILQNLMVTFLQSSAFLIHSMQFPTSGCNREKYSSDRMLRNMLNLAAKFGCPTDLLYIAMYYYKTLRYKEALHVAEVTYEKTVHRQRRGVCPDYQLIYREVLGGQSWTFKMKHTVWKKIVLHTKITYLDELRLEQHSILQIKNAFSLFEIEPYVLIHMLEFFCCIQTDSNRALKTLDDLQLCFHAGRDPGKISWQILGICQQMAGNHRSALHSYGKSLLHASDSDPKIDSATMLRIQYLHLS